MSTYGLDISQIIAWTYPQIRHMRINQLDRERSERLWELTLAAGSMNEEMFDSLYETLVGHEREGKTLQPADGSSTRSQPTEVISSGSHGVDAKGNVIASGAPLLSDIAEGKAMAPQLLRPAMKVIKKDNDGDSNNPTSA